jgi:arylsulfatase A-like enzyme
LLGAIFRKFKQLGIDDNTLVIFAAGQVCDEVVQNIDLFPYFL